MFKTPAVDVGLADHTSIVITDTEGHVLYQELTLNFKAYAQQAAAAMQACERALAALGFPLALRRRPPTITAEMLARGEATMPKYHYLDPLTQTVRKRVNWRRRYRIANALNRQLGPVVYQQIYRWTDNTMRWEPQIAVAEGAPISIREWHRIRDAFGRLGTRIQ